MTADHIRRYEKFDPSLIGQSVHCDSCRIDLTYQIHIRCRECKVGVDFCLPCFAKGQKLITPNFHHEPHHSYSVIEYLKTPIYTNPSSQDEHHVWSAHEELQLLQLVEQCGYGNWSEVAEQLTQSSGVSMLRYGKVPAEGSEEQRANAHEIKIESIRRQKGNDSDQRISEDEVSAFSQNSDDILDTTKTPAELCLGTTDNQLFLQACRWGLVPFYAKKDQINRLASTMINARSEDVHLKNTFKRLLDKRRCIVVFDGFFEWQKKGKEKQPFFVHPSYSNPVKVNKSNLNKTTDEIESNVFDDKPLLYLAALYDSWIDKETNERLYTVAIMTASPADELEWLHNRQPVMLFNEEDRMKWLDCEDYSFADVSYMLKHHNKGQLEWYAVDKCVGSVKSKHLQCAVPMDENKKKAKIQSISSFFKPMEIKNEEKQAKADSGEKKIKSPIKYEIKSPKTDSTQPVKTEIQISPLSPVANTVSKRKLSADFDQKTSSTAKKLKIKR